MKTKDIREMSLEELKTKLSDSKAELFNLLDNPMRIKAVKKDIARIMTVLQEQESAR